jgi:hypothetical protein
LRIASVLSVVAVLALPAVTSACGGRPGVPAGGAASPLSEGVLRASQAPIVGPLDVLDSAGLLGKRVRVLGWCASAPSLLAGRRRGAWMLATPDTTIEVRGLVPKACSPAELRQTLVLVFAQVVPAVPDTAARLLLRLPE